MGNYRGGANMMMDVFGQLLQGRQAREQQQRDNQASMQRQLQGQGFQREMAKEQTSINAYNNMHDRWNDIEDRAHDEDRDDRIAADELERKRLEKEDKFNKTAANTIEEAARIDKEVESIATAYGIEFDPADVHTYDWLEGQIKALEHKTKQSDKPTAGFATTGVIGGYGQSIIEDAKQMLSLPGGKQKALEAVAQGGDLYNDILDITDGEEQAQIVQQIKLAIKRAVEPAAIPKPPPPGIEGLTGIGGFVRDLGSGALKPNATPLFPKNQERSITDPF